MAESYKAVAKPLSGYTAPPDKRFQPTLELMDLIITSPTTQHCDNAHTVAKRLSLFAPSVRFPVTASVLQILMIMNEEFIDNLPFE